MIGVIDAVDMALKMLVDTKLSSVSCQLLAFDADSCSDGSTVPLKSMPVPGLMTALSTHAIKTAYALVGPPNQGPDLPPRAAILLGVQGTVVVCHGAADGTDLAAGIALAADLHRRAAVTEIAALMTAAGADPEVIDER